MNKTGDGAWKNGEIGVPIQTLLEILWNSVNKIQITNTRITSPVFILELPTRRCVRPLTFLPSAKFKTAV
jgi:hypothetical protein